MAVDNGPFDLGTGTGTDSFPVGFTPTWAIVNAQGSGIRDMKGFTAGGGHATVYPGPGEALNTTKPILVKNTAGTVVLEATITFSTNQVNIVKTVNTLGTPRLNIFFGN